MHDARIDPERFRRDLDEQAAIGATGDGGVHRPALTEAHLAARRWWRERIEDDGFTFETDGAGNHSAVLKTGTGNKRRLLLGSHLDSVPHGGRFDGALGVLAAHAVLRAVRDAAIELPFDLEAIDFTDEEGTLVGLLGSRALAGTLPRAELAEPRGGREALERGYARAGLTDDTVLAARRDPAGLAGFLELHIEQGPRLVDGGHDVGIVTAIVGMGSAKLVFTGRADHAGTTPIERRRDAGLAAARAIVETTASVAERFPGCVVNHGRVAFEPGGYNVVPGVATLAVEYRAPERDALAALEAHVFESARAAAATTGVKLDVRPLGGIPPAPCAPPIRDAFRAACDRLGLSAVELASGAGHDTMALADVCPAGMIFVPSSGGSHSPREHCTWQACSNGANALLHATLHLSRG